MFALHSDGIMDVSHTDTLGSIRRSNDLITVRYVLAEPRVNRGKDSMIMMHLDQNVPNSSYSFILAFFDLEQRLM